MTALEHLHAAASLLRESEPTHDGTIARHAVDRAVRASDEAGGGLSRELRGRAVRPSHQGAEAAGSIGYPYADGLYEEVMALWEACGGVRNAPVRIVLFDEAA